MWSGNDSRCGLGVRLDMVWERGWMWSGNEGRCSLDVAGS